MKKLSLVLIGAITMFSCQKRDEVRELPSNTSKANFVGSKNEIRFFHQEDKAKMSHVPGQVMYKLKTEMAARRVNGKNGAKKTQSRAMKAANYSGIYVANVKAGREKEIVEKLKADPDVEWASLNTVHTTQTTPDDPYYTNGSLWGLQNINMPAVWQSRNFGNKQIGVAVVDEGIFPHVDLCSNIWRNEIELAGEPGDDDDDNGYIDDFYGWNWFDGNNDVYITSNHGTHVSGTIGGMGGNQIGVVGVNSNVTLMALKFLNSWGSDFNAILAIDYAIDANTRHGANIRVMNFSWGGGGYNQGLIDAILRAKAAGILVACAAGNANNNNDIDPSVSYPAGYSPLCSNIVGVIATDWNNNKASFSSYGSQTAHIGAPGTGIVSTVYNQGYTSGYAFYSGTSMATPHVAGAAALWLGKHPNATVDEVKAALLSSAKKLPQLEGYCQSGNFLDVSTFLGETQEFQPPFYECYTISPDNGIPTAPTNFEVYDIGFDPNPGAFYGGYAGVRWVASTDPEGNFAGHLLYQNGVAEYALYGATNWVVAGFDDTTQNVIFWAQGFDTWDNVSPFSNPDTAIWSQLREPPTPDTQAPTLNGNPFTSNITQTSITVGWPSASDNVGVTGYELYRDGSLISSHFGNSYVDNGLSPGTTYSYYYRARDAAGNWSAKSGSVSSTTLNPPSECTPTALLGANQSALTVNLNWSIAGDCQVQTTLKRKKGSNGTYQTIATNPSSPYVDTVPNPGFYTYQLVMISGGNIYYSNEVTIKASKR